MPRPRGFYPYNPQKKTLELIEHVELVLSQYVAYLPMTLRQIFYRLVGTDVIGKTENEYNRLVDVVGRARKAEIIDMDAIRDDGFSGGYEIKIGYRNVMEFLDTLKKAAKKYTKDRQNDQVQRLVLWCEAAGMVPQLERVANPYGVTVKSSGGFDSTTAEHNVGLYWGNGLPVEVLHIGDYDPSGECMFDALMENVLAFADRYGNEIEFIRLAVTSEQIRRHNLPTAPPKSSTHQTRKRMTATVQAEALDPETLAGIVKDAIVERMDMKILERVKMEEEDEREKIIERIQGLDD